MIEVNKNARMKVEVWSDIFCPFCYIGKRNFESAMEAFADSHLIDLEWKSFQLDPEMDDTVPYENLYEYFSQRKGVSLEQAKAMNDQVSQRAAEVGLEYKLDKAIPANTFKAHQIIQFAKTKGLGDLAEEQFFAAYFTQGKDLSQKETLYAIALEIGLSEEETKTALESREYEQRVHDDLKEAQEIGVTGVPFFVFNRKYAISGAQPVEVFVQGLKQAVEEWKATAALPLTSIQEGPSCSIEGTCD